MSQDNQRLEHLVAAMKARGLRITPQRLAIMKILAESDNHPSVEAIFHQVKKDFPTTSLATIYKTVTLLKEMGEVLELGFADNASRYDGKRPYAHPHVICTNCGAIVDPAYDGMAEMAERMAQVTGFEITHHRLDFFGICPNCRREVE